MLQNFDIDKLVEKIMRVFHSTSIRNNYKHRAMEGPGLYCYDGEVSFLERHREEALRLCPAPAATLSPGHTTHGAAVTKHRRRKQQG